MKYEVEEDATNTQIIMNEKYEFLGILTFPLHRLRKSDILPAMNRLFVSHNATFSGTSRFSWWWGGYCFDA